LPSDRDRLADLYRTYGPAVYRRCVRLLGDRDSAQDATQEVFRKLLRDRSRLEDPDVALPWLFRVATNHCLNVRRNAVRRGEDELTPDLPLAAPEAAVPDRRLVQRVLSRFDAKTQGIAVGVLVDGMEHEEVAEVLGISSKTVSRKLQRFLENARKYLERTTP
jgi:RNA polymerase sigma-70 factor, ECF subfamily